MGSDPRRVKRETARLHPVAFGSVAAGSTRDSWSEISVARAGAINTRVKNGARSGGHHA